MIHDWHGGGKRPSPEKVARVILHLSRIIAFTHGIKPDPIVHRDLKPANILVSKADGQLVLKVTDFGIGGIAQAQTAQARHTGTANYVYQATAVRGAYSALYASPEQESDPNHMHPSDDVHAIGVIWYQMLTGILKEKPYGSEWKEELVEEQNVPQAMADVIGKCVAKERYRPKDAIALCAKIEELLLPPPKPTPPPPPRSVPHSGADLEAALRLTATPQPIPPRTFAGSKAGERKTLKVGNIDVPLCWCPAGTFTMGSPTSEADRYNDNEAQVEVRVTKGFWMMSTEVTQELYEAVTDKKPSYFHGDKLPVEQVS